MKATLKNIARVGGFVERKAWQLKRGGGLVIGLALITYGAVVPATMLWRASQRHRPAAMPPAASAALHPRS